MPMTSPTSEKFKIYDLAGLRQLIASIAHLPDDTPLEINVDDYGGSGQGDREQGRAVIIFSEIEL